jgi:chaperonin GroES
MYLWESLKDEGKEIATMSIRPLHDRILVKRIESQDVVKGGIVVPDTAKEKPTEGEVIEVGAGKIQKDGKRTPLDLKTGDRILFGKYAGTEIEFEDEELIIMREEDVLAVVAKPNKGKRKKKR